ncbi:response regulator [Aquincola sp. MAHUQ-54]|uniref:Response regulator n=1 Tax=Aquincola agrisoli TaxID=3119538 RepID=A0AAW9QB21_9BURK
MEQLLLRWPRVTLAQADSGEAGIALARSMRPDVVLLDLRLPDMDGLEVLAALKSDDSTRGLRVIALSASAMTEDVRAVRDAGAADYWTKPLDFQQFLGDMQRLLTSGDARP